MLNDTPSYDFITFLNQLKTHLCKPKQSDKDRGILVSAV